MNLRQVRTLDWTVYNQQFPEKLHATDDFVSFENRIILDYHICDFKPSPDSVYPKYRLTIYGRNTKDRNCGVLVEQYRKICDSVAECQSECETWRMKFWNSLLNKMLSEIFSDCSASNITPNHIQSFFLRHGWTKVENFPNPKMMVFTDPYYPSFQMAAPADRTCLDYDVRLKELIHNLSQMRQISEADIIRDMLYGSAHTVE